MAMSKNNNGSYYEAALKRRKTEVQKMVDLKKLKNGSSTIPKIKKEKSAEFKNRAKMIKPKTTKTQLERAALKKNFLKSGKKK
jgi:hypothetical protein